MKKIKGKVLTIAGSDSSGGAGIQADIKTISCMGSYAASALTAITAQNTTGVQAVLELPEKIVRNQIKSVIEDIEIDAIKVGMLSSKKIISVVKKEIVKISKNIPIVLDPVMVAKGGQRLLDRKSERQLIDDLFPITSLLTPNVPEAENITKMKIHTNYDLLNAGKKIISMGVKNVLMKGGHLNGDKLTDILLYDGQTKVFKKKRINSNHTHGTGCTLSSCIAAGLAQKLSLVESVKRAHEYVYNAIKFAPCIGKGKGPLNHLVNIKFE